MEYSSRIKQIQIYFGKRKREYLNGKGLSRTIIYTVVIGFLLALVLGEQMFKEEQMSKSSFFILATICIFYGVFNSVRLVCGEREIIKHEHRSGMHISSYILGYAAFNFFICLLHALVTWGIVAVWYYPAIIGGTETHAYMRLPGYLLTMIIITCAADAMGLFVSSFLKNTFDAMKAMPFVMILQIAFANIVLQLPKMMNWVSNLTLSKWGTNAMMAIGFSNKENPNLLSCWGVLILFTLVFLALSILVLQSIDKDQR
ncbi:MAG: ABC transporter permease [Neisseriaceae bacterium]|nr:ABC transporter permease [Neisseriaceae bacterium]